MAKKEEKEAKIVLERKYNVPLRKEWLKSPRWRRSKKAVKALKEFLAKHMKSDNVKLGKYVNELVWKHGIKNPPHHVEVEATKDSEGKVFADLVGAPKPEKPKEVKKKAETLKEKIQEKVEGSVKPKEAAESKEEKVKKIEKEEIKELKQEKPKVHHAPKPVAKEKRVEEHPNAPMQK